MNRCRNALRLLGLILLMVAVSGCATGYQRPTASYRPVPPQVQMPAKQVEGAIYQAGQELVLFEDNRPRRIGDILTVVLQERTQASKNAKTEASKETAVEIANPTVPRLNANLGVSADSANDFTGDGKSSQSNSLTGNITVTVADVMPNGNLYIRGEKWLTLNQGDEYIQISGIVRPGDIQTDNTILSTQIADARIAYSGKGVLNDVNAMGWLARFFNSAIWPF